MNKVYRHIWSKVLQAYVVTHEGASSHGKSPRARLRVAPAALACIAAASAAQAADPAVNALPTGGQVVSGQAAVTQSTNTMNIVQSTDKAVLNWQTFNIGANASVNFQQPSSNSVALNRVISSSPSSIFGTLNANGQVFLINPSGVLFGPGSRVDVGGIVASTLNIKNDDFLAGNNLFTRDGATGSVVNQGELYGKYIALLAPEVRNEGVIVAQQGTAALAAGDAVTLNITGNNLIDVQVDKASINTLVENKHLIQADEGTVIMSAQSANQLLGQVVNSGTAEAKGISNDGGTIRLLASSTINHSGTISADAGTDGNGGSVILMGDLANPDSATTVSGAISAKGGSTSGDGGFVETSASNLSIESTAKIDTSAAQGATGQWLLDPVDFTIATSGGDITGTALATLLGSNNVTIQTATTGTDTSTNQYGVSGFSGDIYVNDTLTWAAANTLTLNAWSSIAINAPISVNTSGGGLNLQYGQSAASGFMPTGSYTVNAPVNLASGTTFTTKYGSDGATTNYTVISDEAGLVNISAGMTGKYVLGTNITAATNPWLPIGNTDGDYSNGATTFNFTGILDGLGHTIDGLTRANTANSTGVGLFGSIGSGAFVQNLGLTNVNLAGLGSVGALAGASSGTVTNVYATGTVTGSDTAGAVNAVGNIGGLIGNNSGAISQSYSAVTVNAAGGSQTMGAGADGGIGGLAGVHDGTITDSYATGNVTGIYDVGGLVGYQMGSITTSYATGAVTGTTNKGGFVGALSMAGTPGLLTDTFWDTTTSGLATSGTDGTNTSTGLATAAAQTAANYTNFDFTTKWIMYDGISYPLLRSMLTPFIVTADAQTKTYDTNTFTGGGGTVTATYSVTTPGTINLAGLTTTSTDSNAGSYTITPSGVVLTNDAAKQDQHGYRIVFADGALTINQASLSVTGVTASNKTYDATTTATLGGTAAVTALGGDTVTLGGTGAGIFADKNVGVGKAVTVSGYTLGGASAANYTIVQPAGLTATITAANAAVSVTPANKTYDATTTATLGTASVTALGSDTLTVSGTGVTAADFADAEVGTGKAVTLTGNYTLGGADASNYTIVQPTGLTADITAVTTSTTSTTTTTASTVLNVVKDITNPSCTLGAALCVQVNTVLTTYLEKNKDIGFGFSAAIAAIVKAALNGDAEAIKALKQSSSSASTMLLTAFTDSGIKISPELSQKLIGNIARDGYKPVLILMSPIHIPLASVIDLSAWYQRLENASHDWDDDKGGGTSEHSKMAAKVSNGDFKNTSLNEINEVWQRGGHYFEGLTVADYAKYLNHKAGGDAPQYTVVDGKIAVASNTAKPPPEQPGASDGGGEKTSQQQARDRLALQQLPQDTTPRIERLDNENEPAASGAADFQEPETAVSMSASPPSRSPRRNGSDGGGGTGGVKSIGDGDGGGGGDGGGDTGGGDGGSDTANVEADKAPGSVTITGQGKPLTIDLTEVWNAVKTVKEAQSKLDTGGIQATRAFGAAHAAAGNKAEALIKLLKGTNATKEQKDAIFTAIYDKLDVNAAKSILAQLSITAQINTTTTRDGDTSGDAAKIKSANAGSGGDGGGSGGSAGGSTGADTTSTTQNTETTSPSSKPEPLPVKSDKSALDRVVSAVSDAVGSLFSSSSTSTKIEELDSKTTQSDFFMTPPLEIYIEMGDEGGKGDEGDEDFSENNELPSDNKVSEGLEDTDGDGQPDATDPDPFDPEVFESKEKKTTSEGEGDNGEGEGDNGEQNLEGPKGFDSDGDGVPDSEDAFPFDPSLGADEDDEEPGEEDLNFETPPGDAFLEDQT